MRSNGTVTYVGKDIAYHLWKFGLLPGKDFGYARFHEYPTHTCWISTAAASDPAAPTFGRADAIYNVIDSRQNDPQNNVIAALRGMGFTEAADHYTHFSYEMVAMTPRCAAELGYNCPTRTRRGRSSRSAAAKATASRPTTCWTSSSPPRRPRWTRATRS